MYYNLRQRFYHHFLFYPRFVYPPHAQANLYRPVYPLRRQLNHSIAVPMRRCSYTNLHSSVKGYQRVFHQMHNAPMCPPIWTQLNIKSRYFFSCTPRLELQPQPRANINQTKPSAFVPICIVEHAVVIRLNFVPKSIRQPFDLR